MDRFFAQIKQWGKRRGSFRGVDELERVIEDYLNQHNGPLAVHQDQGRGTHLTQGPDGGRTPRTARNPETNL